ncbi:MAG: DNA-3-methyladenine glycosylase 2 family protein [Segetibacter sp.]
MAGKDEDLRKIILQYGYPPLWSRKPTFKTLIHFILEQQVLLASAKAALVKLQALTGSITAPKLAKLTDEELKNCYFSRQKVIYARSVANAILTKKLSLKKLADQPDEVVRTELKRLKGIGEWTADVFLMISLHRTNCFPAGDAALISSLKQIKKLPAHTTKEEILLIAQLWQPYRTIASYLLWHAYLQRKTKKPITNE